MKKLAKILVIAMVLVMMVSTVAFGWGTVISGVDGQPSLKGSAGKIGMAIVGGIRTVGIIIAVAVLVFIGVKFMLASPSEKANIKGMLIPYVIGAVLIVAATQIVAFIFSVVGGD